MQRNVSVSRYISAHGVCGVCTQDMKHLNAAVLNFTQPRILDLVNHASRGAEASLTFVSVQGSFL